VEEITENLALYIENLSNGVLRKKYEYINDFGLVAV